MDDADPFLHTAGRRPGGRSDRPSSRHPFPDPTGTRRAASAGRTAAARPSPRPCVAAQARLFIAGDGISLQQCIDELRKIAELLSVRGRHPRRVAILRQTLRHLEELARCPVYDTACLLPPSG